MVHNSASAYWGRERLALSPLPLRNLCSALAFELLAGIANTLSREEEAGLEWGEGMANDLLYY